MKYLNLVDKSDLPFLQLEKSKLANKHLLEYSSDSYEHKIIFYTNIDKRESINIFFTNNIENVPFIIKYKKVLIPIFLFFGLEFLYYLIFKKYVIEKNIYIITTSKLLEI